MRKLVLTLCALTAMSAASTAANAATIAGAPSCGTWVKDRASKDWPELADTMWLLGYLSGIATTSRSYFLRDTKNDSLTLWVDNYCQANPLDYLNDAGDKLASELIRRSKK